MIEFHTKNVIVEDTSRIEIYTQHNMYLGYLLFSSFHKKYMYSPADGVLLFDENLQDISDFCKNYKGVRKCIMKKSI